LIASGVFPEKYSFHVQTAKLKDKMKIDAELRRNG
jgi:hypothetical protein